MILAQRSHWYAHAAGRAVADARYCRDPPASPTPALPVQPSENGRPPQRITFALRSLTTSKFAVRHSVETLTSPKQPVAGSSPARGTRNPQVRSRPVLALLALRSFFCGDTGLTSQGCRRDPQAPQRPAGAGLRRPRPPHRPQTMGQPPGPWTDQAVLPEAKKIEAELLEQVDRGQHRGSSSRTVAELIERWLNWRQQVRPISPVTVANYRGAIDRYILPNLGRAKVQRSMPPPSTRCTSTCGRVAASVGIAGSGFGGAARRCGLVSGIGPGRAPTKWCTSWTA